MHGQQNIKIMVSAETIYWAFSRQSRVGRKAKGSMYVLEIMHEAVRVKNQKCTLVQELRFCTGRTTQRASRGIALILP